MEERIIFEDTIDLIFKTTKELLTISHIVSLFLILTNPKCTTVEAGATRLLVFFFLFLVTYSIGEIERALDDFTTSCRLNVRFSKPYVNKSIVLCSDQKLKPETSEEEIYLTEYLSNTKETDLGAIYYNRGAIRQQWEKYELAMEDYRNALQNNYHSPHKAHVSIGWCYERMQEFHK